MARYVLAVVAVLLVLAAQASTLPLLQTYSYPGIQDVPSLQCINPSNIPLNVSSPELPSNFFVSTQSTSCNAQGVVEGLLGLVSSCTAAGVAEPVAVNDFSCHQVNGVKLINASANGARALNVIITRFTSLIDQVSTDRNTTDLFSRQGLNLLGAGLQGAKFLERDGLLQLRITGFDGCVRLVQALEGSVSAFASVCDAGRFYCVNESDHFSMHFPQRGYQESVVLNLQEALSCCSAQRGCDPHGTGLSPHCYSGNFTSGCLLAGNPEVDATNDIPILIARAIRVYGSRLPSRNYVLDLSVQGSFFDRGTPLSVLSIDTVSMCSNFRRDLPAFLFAYKEGLISECHTLSPTSLPTSQPSYYPSPLPTFYPTAAPTWSPIESEQPSQTPTSHPSLLPSQVPTQIPTGNPSLSPATQAETCSLILCSNNCSIPDCAWNYANALCVSFDNFASVVTSGDVNRIAEFQGSGTAESEPGGCTVLLGAQCNSTYYEPTETCSVAAQDVCELERFKRLCPVTCPSASHPCDTTQPSSSPTTVPSVNPSISPVQSAAPTSIPTEVPTHTPSLVPSTNPSQGPTAIPSTGPPSTNPTGAPSVDVCSRLHVCHENAVCLNTGVGPLGYECECLTGFTGDGIARCTAAPTQLPTKIPSVSPTTSFPTQSPTTLFPTKFPTARPTTSSPSAVPSASPSLTPTTGIPTNTPTTNECETGTNNCDESAACRDTLGSFDCICNLGFYGDGTACNNIDECTTGVDVCGLILAGSICNDTLPTSETPLGYECLCHLGFSAVQNECVNIDECSLQTSNRSPGIRPGIPQSTTTQGSTVAVTSSAGESIHNCDVRFESVCSDTDGSFLCICPLGYAGNADNTTCDDINECDETFNGDTCDESAICTNSDGSFSCSCAEGYELATNNRSCVDVLECSNSTVCSEHATCFELAGSFHCQCNEGFAGNGQYCEDFDACNFAMVDCYGHRRTDSDCAAWAIYYIDSQLISYPQGVSAISTCIELKEIMAQAAVCINFENRSDTGTSTGPITFNCRNSRVKGLYIDGQIRETTVEQGCQSNPSELCQQSGFACDTACEQQNLCIQLPDRGSSIAGFLFRRSVPTSQFSSRSGARCEGANEFCVELNDTSGTFACQTLSPSAAPTVQPTGIPSHSPTTSWPTFSPSSSQPTQQPVESLPPTSRPTQNPSAAPAPTPPTSSPTHNEAPIICTPGSGPSTFVLFEIADEIRCQSFIRITHEIMDWCSGSLNLESSQIYCDSTRQGFGPLISAGPLNQTELNRNHNAATQFFNTVFDPVGAQGVAWDANGILFAVNAATCNRVADEAAVLFSHYHSVPRSLRRDCTFPTPAPTAAPTESTISPSGSPTTIPSALPTTTLPTTGTPTTAPSSYPTRGPTQGPISSTPTDSPTRIPTSSLPTAGPSAIPSLSEPSSAPSAQPTRYPSRYPSNTPTGLPSQQPSKNPTSMPTKIPSRHPSTIPSSNPSSQRPTSAPTAYPSQVPTVSNPTSTPSSRPSSIPSSVPSRFISEGPSHVPTSPPSPASLAPTFLPSRQPSGSPSWNECEGEFHTCHEDATCTDTRHSFQCACNRGFVGNGQSCFDIEECEVTSDNLVYTIRSGYHCGAGIGPLLSASVRSASECMEAVLLMSRTVCSHTYFHYDSGRCACAEPGINCTASENLTLDARNSVLEIVPTCSEHSLCTELHGGFLCSCNSGFRGDGFECTNIDECTENLDDCNQIIGTCSDLVGGYNCSCVNGYVGDGRNCHDIDECQLDTIPCDPLTDCLNTVGGHQCIAKGNVLFVQGVGYMCADGFVDVGGWCDDFDECFGNDAPCTHLATCTNTRGSFTCECGNGTFGTVDTGCNDINECALGFCQSSITTCENTPGSFTCSCVDGYTSIRGEGYQCTDIDECEEGLHECSGICFNSFGSHYCCEDNPQELSRVSNASIDDCIQIVPQCQSDSLAQVYCPVTCNSCDSGYAQHLRELGDHVSNAPSESPTKNPSSYISSAPSAAPADTTNLESTAKEDDSTLSATAVTLIVILVLCILVVAVFLVLRSRRRHSSESALSHSGSTKGSSEHFNKSVVTNEPDDPFVGGKRGHGMHRLSGPLAPTIAETNVDAFQFAVPAHPTPYRQIPSLLHSMESFSSPQRDEYMTVTGITESPVPGTDYNTDRNPWSILAHREAMEMSSADDSLPSYSRGVATPKKSASDLYVPK